MGQYQDTLDSDGSARSGRKFRPRICHRKSCGRAYNPRSWNQRYCQEPDCMREVRRWHAKKRQRRHRQDPGNLKRHASAQAARRKRKRETPKETEQSDNSTSSDVSDCRPWSRSKEHSSDFCDRPGCYDPRRASLRAPSRYCGNECRNEVRRVRDRERKWLSRNKVATYGDPGVGSEGSAKENPTKRPCASQGDLHSALKESLFSVGDYRASSHDGLSCHSHQPRENHHDDDPKTHSCLEPRSPPTT